MATKRCLPGVTKWDLYGGGTFCEARVHNYGITTSKGNYAIDCTSWPNGRHRGYLARFENVKGLAKHTGLHQGLRKDGSTSDFGDRFHSPAAAAAAANKHCELMNQGLAGSRKRKKR